MVTCKEGGGADKKYKMEGMGVSIFEPVGSYVSLSVCLSLEKNS